MIAAIIQARMGSTRMPGKILYEIEGEPLLKLMLYRIKEAKLIDKIIVATSTDPINDIIETFCIKNDVLCFRGSENDVIDRYYECSKKYGADTIVRLTADCPLADPEIIDKTIALFLSGDYDYSSVNTPPETRKYPDGLDVEVFSFSALDRANTEVTDKLFREHLTFQFWKDKKYKCAQLEGKKDYSNFRITVDYPEDAEVVSFIFRELKRYGKFGWLSEIIEILENNPNIFKLNAKHFFGEGWKTNG